MDGGRVEGGLKAEGGLQLDGRRAARCAGHVAGQVRSEYDLRRRWHKRT